MSDYYIEYRAKLQELLQKASPEVLKICRAWFGETFGQPGQGGVVFVATWIQYAERAVKALKNE